MGRSVTVVLCADGVVWGALPPFEVAFPFWPAVDEIVASVQQLTGLQITVLRILTAPPDSSSGGAVTYLAEVTTATPAGPLDLAPWTGQNPLADQPQRAWFARPGAPHRALRWAANQLAAAGRPTDPAAAQQQKTWNLAGIWRLPTPAGPAWLKTVPPFLAHEGALIARMAGAAVPSVLAGTDGMLLMDDIPGDDQYDATGEPLAEMLGLLRELQLGWVGRVDELIALGVSDRRPVAALPLVFDVVERHGHELDAGVRRKLDLILQELPARLDRATACGLPDTLVHGDFHPGNVRGRPGAFTILDWGDAHVGNPALDWLRLSSWVGEADREALLPRWAEGWRQSVPGCDPEAAAELLRPYSALLRAVTYRRFLDLVEPDEQPYHASDPRSCLTAAAHSPLRPSEIAPGRYSVPGARSLKRPHRLHTQ